MYTPDVGKEEEDGLIGWEGWSGGLEWWVYN